MSIDEAIEKYRYIANRNSNCWGDCRRKLCRECEQEHEQLAECLEELKFLRQWKSDVMDEFCKYDCNSVGEAIHNGYIKAIDDFVKLVHKHDWNIRNRNENSFIYGAIDTLAEQLKAGGENECGSGKVCRLSD